MNSSWLQLHLQSQVEYTLQWHQVNPIRYRTLSPTDCYNTPLHDLLHQHFLLQALLAVVMML